MKKKIQKPSNWQDFESLCKMLWGEMWKISSEIKKNGRAGQPQFGVDIYGIPDGENSYFGIQCKGKDDSLGAKLKEKEVDAEIEKAKQFRPALDTFIIATSADKDVGIEEYLRQRDLESRKGGSFKILYFAWEDISDLIEVNRSTFDYYVLNNQFHNEFDFSLRFEGGVDEIIVNPIYERTTTKYGLVTDPGFENAKPWTYTPIDVMELLHPKKSWINKAWIKIKLELENSGNRVIENYKIFVCPEAIKVRRITNKEARHWLTPDLTIRPFYIFEDEKYGVYRDLEDKPLIQHDHRTFDFDILIEHDATELEIEYELRARDFQKTGVLSVKIQPEIIERTKLEAVTSNALRSEDFILISDYCEEVK